MSGKTEIKAIVSGKGQFVYEHFHFSEATLSEGVLFCSGVIGFDESGNPPADIEAEFKLAWEGVSYVLKQAGGDVSDILEYTSYHVGLQAHMASFMKVRDQFLSEPWPAWTAIGITELAVPGAHVEIKVTARIRSD